MARLVLNEVPNRERVCGRAKAHCVMRLDLDALAGVHRIVEQ